MGTINFIIIEIIGMISLTIFTTNTIIYICDRMNLIIEQNLIGRVGRLSREVFSWMIL
jgi:hypothetical protein